MENESTEENEGTRRVPDIVEADFTETDAPKKGPSLKDLAIRENTEIAGRTACLSGSEPDKKELNDFVVRWSNSMNKGCHSLSWNRLSTTRSAVSAISRIT